MEFLSFEQWKSQIIPFLSRWADRLGVLLTKSDMIDLFLNNEWSDFEPDFEKYFQSTTPSVVSKLLKENDSRKIITRIVAIVDLKHQLKNALDGESSLSLKEYIKSIVVELKELKYELENPISKTIHLGVADLLTSDLEMDEPTLEPVENIEDIADDMVEEEVDIGKSGEKILDDSSISSFRDSKLTGSISGGKRKYDSGLSEIDPSVSGPIVSLAGMRKGGSKVSSVISNSEKSFNSLKLSPALSLLRDAVKRVGEGNAVPGEKEVLENMAYRLLMFDPANSDNIASDIKDLDRRLSIISGEEGDFKVEAIMIMDKITTVLHRKIDSVITMSAPQFLLLTLSDVMEKDGYEGEFRSFTLDFSTQKRVMGFHHGKLDFNLLYYPKVIKLKIVATGSSKFKTPFIENEAEVIVDYDNNSEVILINFAMRAMGAYIRSLFS